MAVRIIKKSWWVDIRFNHKRYQKRSPENSRTGALAYEATLRHKLARGESIDKQKHTSHQEQLFGQFAWKWFEEYVLSNNKPSEQRTKKYILSASLVPFFGKLSIGQITSHHIEQYKARTSGRGVTNKTINNRLTVLKKCLGMAYEWLELDGAPPKITWLKVTPPKTSYLTYEECDLLLSNADGIVRDMLLVALRTGMRQGELRGLQWSSIDWQNRSIAVRHSRCDYTKELGSPKSNRERHIPIDDEVYWVLAKRKEASGYVFVDADGKPFDHQRLALRLANIRKKAGLRKFGWHTLRHTFASHLTMKGAPLSAVQMLLGHSTITMTMRYAHLAPSVLRATIDLLGAKQLANKDFGEPVGNQKSSLLEKPYER